MRLIPAGKKYNSRIWVDDKTKEILKIDCGCPNFVGIVTDKDGKSRYIRAGRIKKIGEFSGIKYFATYCKHLKPVVEALKKLGFKLEKPKEMIGPDKLSVKLRKKLLERAKHKCECGCESEGPLVIHRKMRGSAGGKYNIENCQVLYVECHKLRHVNEFPSRRLK